MDLEQLSKLKIPEKQAERNKVLTDALETGNPLLIEFALSIGAEPRVGGEKLLKYAVEQGNLALVQKQVLYIESGKTTAMCMAIDNDQVEIANWLAKEGAVMIIGQERNRKHWETLLQILSNNPEANTDIKYGALLHATLLPNGVEVLKMLLSSMKRNQPDTMKQWLIRLADDTVDGQRVDCMEVMVQFGLNVAYVNTKYCYHKEMRKFLKEHGARID